MSWQIAEHFWGQLKAVHKVSTAHMVYAPLSIHCQLSSYPSNIIGPYWSGKLVYEFRLILHFGNRQTSSRRFYLFVILVHSAFRKLWLNLLRSKEPYQTQETLKVNGELRMTRTEKRTSNVSYWIINLKWKQSLGCLSLYYDFTIRIKKN